MQPKVKPMMKRLAQGQEAEATETNKKKPKQQRSRSNNEAEATETNKKKPKQPQPKQKVATFTRLVLPGAPLRTPKPAF